MQARSPRSHKTNPARLRGRRNDVLDAALTLFAERGYAATTMDDIALAVGMRAPSLYNHVGSKQEILQQVVSAAMSELLAAQAEAAKGSRDVAYQLRRVAEANVLYHARHRREAVVANRDIVFLEEPVRSTVFAQRDVYERVVVAIVERGVSEGRFTVDSVKLATFALLEMAIPVPVWFRSSGPMSAEEIASHYGEFALRIVGAGRARRTKRGSITLDR